ncbi:T9SS type A sorting domain-containing protein [Wenyingzhuangia sp. IMCC45533]
MKKILLTFFSLLFLLTITANANPLTNPEENSIPQKHTKKENKISIKYIASTHVINVNSTNNGVIVKIYNLKGKRVKRKYILGNKGDINISNFSNGVYVIEASTPENKLTRTQIVKG